MTAGVGRDGSNGLGTTNEINLCMELENIAAKSNTKNRNTKNGYENGT